MALKTGLSDSLHRLPAWDRGEDVLEVGSCLVWAELVYPMVVKLPASTGVEDAGAHGVH